MKCQIRRNNIFQYEELLKGAKKLEILFAEEVLLQKNFVACCEEINDIEIYGSKISREHDDILKILLMTQKSIMKLELNCTITSSLFLSILNQTNIQELYLTHLLFNHKPVIESLCNGIEMSNLKSLDLSYNDFDNVSFKKLTTSLKKTCIKFLFLCCCNITKERSFYLFQILPHAKINYLDLFQNDIEDEGIEFLSTVLPDTQMKFLDIGKNSLSDVSCFHLAKVLPKTVLQNLWINDHHITKNGIEHIYKIARQTYITNFQYPLRLMSRFHFIPVFFENRKKIRQYNRTVHYRNFLSLLEIRKDFTLEVLFISELSEIIMTFL